MRIAVLNSLLPPLAIGGAGKSTQELANDLRAAGHDVLTLSIGNSAVTATVGADHDARFASDFLSQPLAAVKEPSIARKLAWHGTETIRPRVRRFVQQQLDAFGPDVVHTNNIAGFGASAWRAAGSLPLVHTLRDYYLLCAQSNMFRDGSTCESRCLPCRAMKEAWRLVRRRPDVYVGISQHVLDVHLTHGFIGPDAATRVVHNAPELDLAAVTHRPRDAVPTFGLLGRINGEKGSWVFLDGFIRAVRNGVKAQLVVAGKVGEHDRDRLDAALDECDAITYLGNDVPPESFFSAVDVVAVPSQWAEPFGRVAAEAISARRPVLVSQAGGLPEVVTEGSGEVIADFTNPLAWSEAVTRWSTPSSAEVPPSSNASSVSDQYLAVYEHAIRMRAR